MAGTFALCKAVYGTSVATAVRLSPPITHPAHRALVVLSGLHLTTRSSPIHYSPHGVPFRTPATETSDLGLTPHRLDNMQIELPTMCCKGHCEHCRGGGAVWTPNLGALDIKLRLSPRGESPPALGLVLSCTMCCSAWGCTGFGPHPRGPLFPNSV